MRMFRKITTEKQYQEYEQLLEELIELDSDNEVILSQIDIIMALLEEYEKANPISPELYNKLQVTFSVSFTKDHLGRNTKGCAEHTKLNNN